jgi:hypothetical protein
MNKYDYRSAYEIPTIVLIGIFPPLVISNLIRDIVKW